MLSPSRRKNGCGGICTSISASPAGPPPKPGPPLPLRRRIWPSSMPGGIVTSSHSSGDKARRCLPPVRPSTAEHLEQIIEIADIHLALGPVLPPLRALGMRPIGIARPLGSAFVDLAAIVAGALLRIRQDVVGGRDRLEARLGGRLPRVQIGVKLLRELAVGLA